MPSSIAAAWPSPGRFALALLIGLAVTLGTVWMWGATLIENLLPLTRYMLVWIDDRFGILFLGVERNWQDTVIHMRLNLSSGFVMGGRVVMPDPRGVLKVATPVGSLLQPLAIAPAIAAALPGKLDLRLMRFGLAALLALGFLIIDLPITLHAIAWDMIIYSLGVADFSPLLVWYQFTQSGGRLGIAVILGIAGWRLARKAT